MWELVRAAQNVAAGRMMCRGQLLVSSSTVPPAAPPPATGASNGLPGASPHSTRTYPASSRPHSASPLPRPCPCLCFVVYDGPQHRAFAEPEPALIVGVDTGNHQSNCHRRPSARGATAGTCVETQRRTGGFGQPQSSRLWCLPAHPAETATDPAQAVERQREHDHAFGSGDHPVPISPGGPAKATPRPAPVPAPQPATTVQRGATMGLNTGSPLLIGNPAAAQPGMFPAGPAQGTFLLNQYIPGLGHSPILIQGALRQTQSSLGQIQGVQLARRPPHATGLTLGPQTGPRPHGGHPGPPGTPTLVIPQNLGPRPNIFLAPPRMMSPPLVCHSPGTATDAATAAGHAAHADHADPAHTGGQSYG
ncbi:hypothetical protein MRX96_021247 [Rhipicephalus microplus]